LYVPIQNLKPEISFEGFIGENRNRRVYALCFNNTDKEIGVPPPTVTLIPCEVIEQTPESAKEDKVCFERAKVHN